MAGKRVLPLLGGSAAVWTACLVFFQTALLAGYASAHWIAGRLQARRQAAVFVAMLAISIAQLAVSVDGNHGASTAHPISSVLWLLTLWIGIPFITLSVTSPLLQSWLAAHSSKQPYRLYAVSNVGSLLALLVYPTLIEPRLSLREQQFVIIAGFALLIVAVVLVAAIVRRAPSIAMAVPESAEQPSGPAAQHPAPSSPALWVALAACGSMLLSAVTSHLSQDVATIPLLWILPLIVYLLSFVIGFSGERWHPRPVILGLMVVGLGGATYVLSNSDLYLPIPATVAIFCGALFVLCLFCHSELYRRRPHHERLTSFYIWVAAGGALGAALVGIVAPLVLPGSYELALGFFAVAMLALITTWADGVPMRALWAIAAAGMVGLVGWQVHSDRDSAVAQRRNFYGTLRVIESGGAIERVLVNGVIQHGKQVFSDSMRREPTTYYGHASGVGLAIDLCCNGRPRRIGVVGLGTGTLAAYGRPGDVIRFYDINPAVEPIARKYFTYLTDSRAKVEVVLGDARVSMANEAPQRYDVLAVDAFSGDAIPIHLITSQALEVYRRHLAPGGVVAFHVSNRYLDLAPVVEQIARHARMRTALLTNPVDTAHFVYSSDWVLVTDNVDLLSQPAIGEAHIDITIPPRLRRWTDDYNSLLPVLHWRSSSP